MKNNKLIYNLILAVFAAACILSVGQSAQSRVNTTQQQKQQLKTLAQKSRNETRHKRDELRRTRGSLIETYNNYDLNINRAKGLINKISRIQLDLLNIHLNNQIAIRFITTEEQFDEFVQMAKKRMHFEPKPPHMFGNASESPEDMCPTKEMLTNAGITTAQIKHFRELIGPEQKRTVANKLRKNSKQLIDIYSKYNLDTASAKKLISAIHNNQVELTELNFKRQLILREIITQDQFKRLQAEITAKAKNHASRN